MLAPTLFAPILIAATLIALPATAQAQESRELCSTRPGLGTAPCIADAGRIVTETALVGFSRDDDGTTRTDTLTAVDALARFGIDGESEVQIGWTAFGRARERDLMTDTATPVPASATSALPISAAWLTPTAAAGRSRCSPSRRCRWAAMRSARAIGGRGCWCRFRPRLAAACSSS